MISTFLVQVVAVSVKLIKQHGQNMYTILQIIAICRSTLREWSFNTGEGKTLFLDSKKKPQPPSKTLTLRGLKKIHPPLQILTTPLPHQ